MSLKSKQPSFAPIRVRAPDQMGQAIRTKRKARGISQAELAKKAGINQRTVSIIENGSKTAELSTIFSLLMALGLEILIQDRPSEDTGFDAQRFFG